LLADIYPLILVLGSLTGAFLLAFGKPFFGYVVWVPINLGLTVHNYVIGQTAQAVLFAIFFVLACVGLVVAGNERTGNERESQAGK